MGNRQTAQPVTSSLSALAEAMGGTSKPTQETPAENPVLEQMLSQGGVTPRFDSDEVKNDWEAKAEEQRLLNEQAVQLREKVAPVDTSVEVYRAEKAKKEAEDTKQQEFWRAQILAAMKQKAMADGSAPQAPDQVVRQASKSSERLLAEAEKEVAKYNPAEAQEPFYAVWNGKQAKLKGHRQTAGVQKNLKNSELSLHAAGGQ